MAKARRPSEPDPVSDNDAELFREAVGDVRPVPRQARTDARAAPPKAVPRRHLEDEAGVLDELARVSLDALAADSGEAISYLRDGYDPRLLKRLKNGSIAVQDEIDLHALRLKAAQAVLREFLAEATGNGLSCLRIIHGKGLRSKDGPVLRTLVDRSLRLRNDVVAFCSARAGAGGTGVTLVLMRQRGHD